MLNFDVVSCGRAESLSISIRSREKLEAVLRYTLQTQFLSFVFNKNMENIKLLRKTVQSTKGDLSLSTFQIPLRGEVFLTINWRASSVCQVQFQLVFVAS